ncbi:MAG: hypothetical protein P1U83_04290 [Roseovarius sp.]|nr:hypothetical protein [Roseovarius sp.]
MTKDEKEIAQLERLKKIMPVFATVMALSAFFLIYMSGHGFGTASMVGLIMLAFVLFLWGMRIVMGTYGFIAGLFTLCAMGWLAQYLEWI